MKKLFLILAFVLASLSINAIPAKAQFNNCAPGFCNPRISGSSPTSCAESAAFIARTSGLDATHLTAYDNFICGLVTDGIWTKFDVIRVYATQNSSTALLNLVSASYTGTSHGSPTFTVDRGFTGTDLSTTVYIDSGFNPSTASGQYTRDSAHLSAWIVNNTGNSQPQFGYVNSGSTNVAYVWSRFNSDNKSYVRINNQGTSGSGIDTGLFTGHHLDRRLDNATAQGYQNGSSIGTVGTASIALLNQNFYEIGINNNGTPDGAGAQQAMISIGASMSTPEVSSFYGRLRTLMTAVGVP